MFQRTVGDKMRIEVFRIRLYDVANDKSVISRRMATELGADKMGGNIIEGSGVLVDPTDLEYGEQWTKIGFEPS